MLVGRQPRNNRGFTLIEVAIVMVIIAIVLTFGLPGFAEWSQNTQIRATVESIQSGLQTARYEAVRRNTRIEFRLSGNIGNEGATGWSIWTVTPSAEIQSKPDREGSRRIVVTTPNANATERITFDGTGRTPAGAVANADGTAFLTTINITSPAVSAPRNLRLLVSPGGMVQICDPNPNIAAGDPRRCP